MQGEKMHYAPQEPYNSLPKLPSENKIESLPIWKAEAKARSFLAELKGVVKVIPNMSILINAVNIQEAKDPSGIENIITTKDKLYQAISAPNSNRHSNKRSLKEALYYGYNKIKKKL